MPFYLAQGGSTLYRMDTNGTLTPLVLPDTVTVSAALRLRSAILGRNIVLVNSPSQTLAVDPLGRIRTNSVQPPATPPSLVAGGAGSLIGQYRVKVTFLIKDEDGRVLAESDFGPPSDPSAALVSQTLQVNAIPRSSNAAVNGRRLYRTTSGPGDTYFQWIDVDGNTVTTVTDGVTDEGLATLAAPTDLGTPSVRFDLIVAWKDRLWGHPSDLGDIDLVAYSAARKPYAWPASQQFSIPPAGKDDVGVTGFIPRRDELGIARQDIIHKIVGRTPANFERLQLVEGTGVIAPDSVCVIRDVGYWLAGDGVYSWGPSGVEPRSAQQAGWFQSDRYFNRAMFPQAFATYNRQHQLYQLHLAGVGSTAIDRWVGLEITTGRWHGPHKTGAFTPTTAAEVRDTNGLTVPFLGGDTGFIYKLNRSTYLDDATAIDFDVRLRHTMNTPDLHKVVLEPTVYTRPESGGTLDVIPALGTESAAEQPTIAHNLTRDRERLRRISTSTNPVGRMLTLRFRNTEASRGVQLRGYEVPYFEEGRR